MRRMQARTLNHFIINLKYKILTELHTNLILRISLINVHLLKKILKIRQHSTETTYSNAFLKTLEVTNNKCNRALPRNTKSS